MHYVYILKSLKDSTYYVGYTADLEARIKTHNKGKNKYTKGHIPYELLHSEAFENIKEAKIKEKKIKNKGAKRYLEILSSPAPMVQD